MLLTALLLPIVVLGSWKGIERHWPGYAASLLLLTTGMLGALVALDLFLFYVFWEVMLIPMYLIIGIWGGERRIYAAVKFFLFTMAGSLLMLARASSGSAGSTASSPASGASRYADLLRLDLPVAPAALAVRAPSRSPSRSRCRCSRSTPGCPTPTSRRPPAAR